MFKAVLLMALCVFGASGFASEVKLSVGNSATIGDTLVTCEQGDDAKCTFISGEVYCGYGCDFIMGNVYCANSADEKCTFISGNVYCGLNCEFIHGNVYCVRGGIAFPATPSRPAAKL